MKYIHFNKCQRWKLHMTGSIVIVNNNNKSEKIIIIENIIY